MQFIKQNLVSTLQRVFSELDTPEIVVVAASGILSIVAVIATY